MARYVKYGVLLAIIAVGATMAYMAVAEPTAKAGGCGGGCGGGCMMAKPAAAPAAGCKCADGKPCTCKGECKCADCKCATCGAKAGTACAAGKPCVGKDKCTCGAKAGACGQGGCKMRGMRGGCQGGQGGCKMRGAHGPKWPTKTGPDRSLGQAFHVPG